MKKIFFLIITNITFMFLFVELYTYKYFLFRHFYINTDIFIGLSFILGYISINGLLKKSKSIRDKMVCFILYFDLFLACPLIIVYLYLKYLDYSNYQNYIFSIYHLQPDLLIRPIILSFSLIALLYYKTRLSKTLQYKQNISRIWYKQRPVETFLSVTLIALIFTFGISNLLIDISNAMPDVFAIIMNINSNDDDKLIFRMKMKYGIYDDYIKFIKMVVPENSSMLLPPQKNPWQYEGNQRLTRFFLYPRTLYSAHESNLPENVDFITIAWGNSAFPPAPGDHYGWPRYEVKAEKVYIYDFDTKSYTTYNGDYNPETILKPGVYGLIKTK